jgi:hypothetical protein
MNRGVLALLKRSLSIRHRAMSTYFMRFGLVLIVFFFVLNVYQSSSYDSRISAPGLLLFSGLSGLNTMLIFLASLSIFASAITEEKEDGTLALLRMTNLSPLAIIIGKSGARGITCLLLLATQIPFTLLAITFGGIGLDQILSMYAALGALLFFTANFAVCASVIVSKTRNAAGLTLLFFGFFFATPLFIQGLHVNGSWSWMISVIDQAGRTLQEASIFSRFQIILGTEFDGQIWSMQVQSNLILGVLFFVVGWLSFNRFNQNEVSSGPTRSRLMSPLGLLRRKRRRVWNSAIIWKDYNFIGGGLPITIAKVFGYGGLIILIGFVISFRGFDLPAVAGLISGIFLFVLVAELALLAGRIFKDEMQWKTWASLNMLPRSDRGLVYGKLAGASLSLLPAIGFLMLGPVLDPKGFNHSLGEILDQPESWWMFFNVCFFLHLIVVLSLWIRSGAVPIAFGLVILLNVVVNLGIGIMYRGHDSLPIAMALVILATIALHILARLKLRWLAAEG